MEDTSDSYKLTLKPYKISKTLSLSPSSNNNNNNGQAEEIRDARFMSNGLKIMILTNYGKLVVIEAHNFIAGQNVKDIIEGLSNRY